MLVFLRYDRRFIFDNKHGLRVRTRRWLARGTTTSCMPSMATLGQASLRSTTYLVDRVLQAKVVSFCLAYVAQRLSRTRRYTSVRTSHYTRFADGCTVSGASIIAPFDSQSSGHWKGVVVLLDIAGVGMKEISRRYGDYAHRWRRLADQVRWRRSFCDTQRQTGLFHRSLDCDALWRACGRAPTWRCA